MTISRIDGSSITNRSAHAAIKGYEYQFDRTVLEILAASDNAEVHIEGIEDVDLISPEASRAIQVKYYESQRYTSPKSLREPLRLMLNHHRTGARWSYVLHVHFGEQGDLPTEFTLEQMKSCLTKRDRTSGNDVEYFSGLNDDELRDFCGRVSIRSGVTFDDQQNTLVGELARSVGCATDEVHAIYLAKARDFVRERARDADAAVRIVKRDQLLTALNVRELLFNGWQLAALGEEKYVQVQTAHLKRRGFTDTKRHRAMCVDLTEESFAIALAIAKDTASAHLGRLKNAKPWTLILSGSSTMVHAFKVSLVRDAIDYNDGYESVEFSAPAFIRPPLINLVGTSDKLKNSSYLLRVISDASFRANIGEWPKLARLIVLGASEDWHEAIADDTYVLKDYEPGLLRALIGGVV